MVVERQCYVRAIIPDIGISPEVCYHSGIYSPGHFAGRVKPLS
jgi:hypothetical protein